jgi:hypothetical protein
LTVVDESKEGVIKSVSYESEVSLVPLIRKRPLIGDQVYNIEKLLFHLRGVHVGLEIEGSSEVNKAQILLTKTLNFSIFRKLMVFALALRRTREKSS